MVKLFTKQRLAASATAGCWAGFDEGTGAEFACAAADGRLGARLFGCGQGLETRCVRYRLVRAEEQRFELMSWLKWQGCGVNH
jgi:hypothetical protein